MDIYQFIDETETIWRDIQKLDEKAPPECSAVIAIARRCLEELAYLCYEEKKNKVNPK